VTGSLSRLSLAFGLAVVLAACAGSALGPMDPHPVVTLPERAKQARIEVAPEVADGFETARRGRAQSVRVTGWRKTLTRAFENALGHRTSVDPALGPMVVIKRAQLTLVEARAIDQERSARVAWVAAADGEVPILLAHGEPQSAPQMSKRPAVPVYAEIDYVAELRDGRGSVIAASRGRVLSTHATGGEIHLRDAIVSAVEEMFERLLADLFVIP